MLYDILSISEMLLYWELTTFFWTMCSMFLLTTCKCSLMSLKCWIVSYDPSPPVLPCCWPTANCFSEPDNESLQSTTLVQCFMFWKTFMNLIRIESDTIWNNKKKRKEKKSWTFSKIFHARWFNIKALKRKANSLSACLHTRKQYVIQEDRIKQSIPLRHCHKT